MSEQYNDALDVVISKSDFENVQNELIQSPASLVLYLESKIVSNAALIQELSSLISFVFPSNPRKLSRKNSMEQLMRNLNELEISCRKEEVSASVSQLKSELFPQDFSEVQCAGFLLIAFALKSDFAEMAFFIAKEFPEFTRNFLASSSTGELLLKDQCKLIYQGLYDSYKESEEKVFKKLLEFMRKRPELTILKRNFYKLVSFNVKTVNPQLLECLLESFEDLNAFLKENGRKIMNENDFFEGILLRVKSESPTNRKRENEEKSLAKFSIKCLENNWESIFRLLVIRRGALLDNMRIFKAALQSKNTRILKNFMKINENAKELLLDQENFSMVLDFLENEANFLDGVFLLDQIKAESLDIFYQRVLITKFEALLASTNKSPISLYRVLLSHVNPFGLCCILSEIFHEIATNSEEFKLKFDFLAVEFRELALSILEKLQNSVNLHLLLTKTFFPAEIPILELLLRKRGFFENILIKPNVYSIILEIWDSPYESTYDFLRFSTGYCLISGKMSIFPDMDLNSSILSSFAMDKSITVSPSNSPKKASKSEKRGTLNGLKSILSSSSEFATSQGNLFKYLKTADCVNERTNFVYQLKVFTKCMGFRYFIEFLSFSIAFVVILSVLMGNLTIIFSTNEAPKPVIRAVLNFIFLTSGETDMAKNFGKFLAAFPSDQQGAFLAFFSKASQYETNHFICKTALYLHYRTMDLEIATNDREIEECVKVFSSFTSYDDSRIGNIFKEFLLIITCFTGILQVIYYFFKNKKFRVGFPQFVDFLIIAFTIILISYNSINDPSEYIDNFEHILENMKIALIAIILLIFIKIILFMRMTHSLGVPLRILFKMMSHLSTIIIMFVIIFTSFTVFMYFLFTKREDHYETLFKSFKSLFKFVFGEMIYYHGSDALVDYSYFSLLTIGLVFIRILFLNILIAILSNIYESIQKKSGLEISLMIHAYNEYQDPKEKTMNSLVLLPSPFNVVSFLLFPWILLKRSTKLNEFVLKFGYCGLLLCMALLFISAHLVILPWAWLLVLYRLLMNIYGEDYESSKIRITVRIGHIAQWTLFGTFYMVYVLFKYDLRNFWRKGFENVHEPTKNDEFNVEEYKTLKKVVRIYLEIHNEKRVKTEEFWKKFRRISEVFKEFEEVKNEEVKKNEDLLVLMKNNFGNLSVEKEIRVEMVGKLLENIKKMKMRKNNGVIVKHTNFMDIVNLQAVGDTIKLFQYKNQLLK